MTQDAAAALPVLNFLLLHENGRLCEPSGTDAQPRAGKHWYVIAAPTAILHRSLGAHLLAHARRRPDVGIFYGDEEHAAGLGTQRFLKPDFDLALLLAMDYVGTPLCIRGDVLARLGGVIEKHGPAASYDLAIRAVQAGVAFARIPEVLVRWHGPRAQAPRKLRRHLLQTWLDPQGHRLSVRDGVVPDTLELHRRIDAAQLPALTICIVGDTATPAGEAQARTRGLLGAIGELGYPQDRLHVIINEGAIGESVDSRPFAIHRVPMPAAAGIAVQRNLLWRAAKSEQILFVSNRIALPPSADWLGALLAFSMEEDVGGCAARLLEPSGALWHGGVAATADGVPHRLGQDRAVDPTPYTGWALVQREWSMVSCEAFACRRSLLQEVGGFDETLGPWLHELDLCLKLRMLGYRIVYAPHAELIRVAAAGNDPIADGMQLARFMERWHPLLSQDPSWHPCLDVSVGTPSVP